VVRAAVAIADSDGLDAVTFRAVAARLGTGVMSLYNYVPDKQALVYEMVELVGAEVVCQRRRATGAPTCTLWPGCSAISPTGTRG
jgi:AcrR family transcriptional regulator